MGIKIYLITVIPALRLNKINLTVTRKTGLERFNSSKFNNSFP